MDIDKQRDSRPDGGGVQHGDTTRLLAEKAAAIHELARRTRELARRTIENIVRIGQYLVEARADVGYGAWLTWIEVEFNWSDQTARRFIHLHELSRNGKINTVLNLDLPLGVLYQLAAPKAVAARQEIAERIEAGEPISQETVIEAIKGHGKSPSSLTPPPSPAGERARRRKSARSRTMMLRRPKPVRPLMRQPRPPAAPSSIIPIPMIGIMSPIGMTMAKTAGLSRDRGGRSCDCN